MKCSSLLLVGLSLLYQSLTGASRAEAVPAGFQVVATFDYPGQPQGALFGTYPMGISDDGVVVGDVFMSDFSHHGFVRAADGSFSGLVNEPNDTAAYYTLLTGVNTASLMTGYYRNDEGHYSAFLLENGVFSEFSIAGAVSTYIFGLNNAGDLCGHSEAESGSTGFVDVAGTITSFSVPDPIESGTKAYGINNLGLAAGYYDNIFGQQFGFARKPTGHFVYPIRAGSSKANTVLFGINDRGMIVGQYTDATGEHAALFTPKGRYVAYDYPGSNAQTVFHGINNQGLICGYYSDSAGVHGFIVRKGGVAGN